MLMNVDSFYIVVYCVLFFNLKFFYGDYYRKWLILVFGVMKDFMKQVQISGVLMVFFQVWIEEFYYQVFDRNMFGEVGYWGSLEDNSFFLIIMLIDIDGLESSVIGGQLMVLVVIEFFFVQSRRIDDFIVVGVVFVCYILVGCWKNLIDILLILLIG